MKKTTPPTEPDTVESENTNEREGIFWEAILAYVPLFCLYPWSIRNRSPEIEAHARQGMILFIAELVLMLTAIRFFYGLLWIGVACMAILGILAALRRRPYRLPVLADLADRLSQQGGEDSDSQA